MLTELKRPFWFYCSLTMCLANDLFFFFNFMWPHPQDVMPECRDWSKVLSDRHKHKVDFLE